MTHSDDLGRVVIPKEIRRTMRIREGDPLEIYTDSEGEVIFKKYSPIGELASFATQYAETLHKTCDYSMVITDRDSVVACAGIPKRELVEKKISDELISVLEMRKPYITGENDKRIPIQSDTDRYYARVIMPIVSEGDIVGGVAIVSPADEFHKADTTETKILQTAAAFLGKQLEN